LVGKEEADAHLYQFGCPAGLQMQLHDEIASRLQTPGETCGGGMRRLPGSPIEQLSFGAGIRHHPARVPGLGIEGSQMSRETEAVDHDIRVVDNAGIPT